MKDLEQAFPSPHFYGKDYQGMTLRDYFAGKAMSGILSNANASKSITDRDSVAKWSYEYADAMLKAREVKKLNPDTKEN